MVRIDRARLKAWFLLTSALLAWLLSKLNPFTHSRRGLDHFISQYAETGLVATTAEQRATATTLSNCVLCGVCDQLAAQTNSPRSPLDHLAAASRPGAGQLASWPQFPPSSELSKLIAAHCPTRARP